MNAVFTICAKNYLPRARTLGDSIRRLHPDLAFHVFLVDEPEGWVQPAHERFCTMTVSSIAIPHFRQMAFKYDVLELSCAVKPYLFQYLFREYGYDRLIYFDPDVFVYSSLEVVFSLLDNALLVLTPHLTKLEAATEGAMPLGSFLFVGAFNLGFAAIRDCERARTLVGWWADRVADEGFGDRIDAQHVDQKWMDLAPGMLGDDLVISRDPGLNAAQWNMHERRLETEGGRYLMDGRPLVFYHHTSFHPRHPERLAQRQSKFTLENRPEYGPMMKAYAEQLLANGYEECSTWPYSFASFANGMKIFHFQRRLFRQLLARRGVDSDPFSTGPDSFYALLERNGLVVFERERSEFVQADFRSSGTLVRLLKWSLVQLKRIVGIKRYYLLIRWFFNNTRPEDQMFLLKKGWSSLR